MPSELIPEERLDETLRGQPVWEPPPGFARRVVARVSIARADWPAMEHRGRFAVLRTAAAGIAAAAAAYVVGSLATWVAPAITDRAVAGADRYAMFVERATGMLVAHATLVAWISAAFALSIAATAVRRDL